MATPENRADLRRHIRNRINAWTEDVTTLTEALDATETGIDVTDATYIEAKMILEIGDELMRVRSKSSNTLTVLRGDRGSTAATASNGATVTAWPAGGWPNAELNDYINQAIDWLSPEVWYMKSYDNTVLANRREFGLPSGVRYPDGEHVHEVQFEIEPATDTLPARYKPTYFWRHLYDKVVLDYAPGEDTPVRIFVIGRHARMTSDSSQLFSSDPVNAIVNYASKLALENLVGNRARYVEYSASLNDRASTSDELIRLAYDFYNQAVLEKDRISRVRPASFASVRRHE